MDSIIRNGVTIIKMPPPNEIEYTSKHGALGACLMPNGKYRLTVRYKGKRYNFGEGMTIEEAKALRDIADEKKADGSFIEWYESNYKPKTNKFGVSGLGYNKTDKLYQLYIGFNKTKHFIGKYKDIETAALVRTEADKHIADGTFLEWLEEYKTKKQHKG